jgi:hypothetical protein
MNLRIATPLTIVGVAIICGVSLWTGTGRDHAPNYQSLPARRTNGLAPENRVAPPAPLVETAPAALPVARNQPAAEEIQGPAPAESNYAKTELPVEFNYQRSPSNPQMFAVTLFNKAEEAMTLDVMIFNTASGQTAETQLDIGPMQSRNIGIDDNFEIGQGDRITLRNPSYHDLVAEIRPR